MASPGRLRVVVLNYNHARMTLSCVRSIMAQRYAPLDVVVVDNCSADADYRILADELPRSVTLVRSPRNGGYAAGNNVGARYPGLPPAAFVMVVNNDVVFPHADTCSRLVAALEREPIRAACSPLVDTPNGAGLPPEATVQVRRLPGVWQLIVVHSWWLRRLPGLRSLDAWYTYADRRPFALNEELDCESINGSCFVTRQDVLEQIGFLDEGTFLYFEELILGRQLKRARRTACLVTSTRVIHDQGATTGHGGKRVRLRMLKFAVASELHYCREYLDASRAAIAVLLCVRAIDMAGKAVAQALRVAS